VNVALAIFVTIVLGDVMALALDVFLLAAGEQTITSLLRVDTQFAIAAVAVQLIGALALAFHIWG
jgi:hypothetical protein